MFFSKWFDRLVCARHFKSLFEFSHSLRVYQKYWPLYDNFCNVYCLIRNVHFPLIKISMCAQAYVCSKSVGVRESLEARALNSCSQFRLIDLMLARFLFTSSQIKWTIKIRQFYFDSSPIHMCFLCVLDVLTSFHSIHQTGEHSQAQLNLFKHSSIHTHTHTQSFIRKKRLGTWTHGESDPEWQHTSDDETYEQFTK